MSRPVMTPYRSFQARSMKAPAKHQALHSSAEMIPLASKPTLYSTSVSDRPAPTSIKNVFVNQHQALPSRAEMIPLAPKPTLYSISVSDRPVCTCTGEILINSTNHMSVNKRHALHSSAVLLASKPNLTGLH